jgi:hypothetical protein
MAKYLGVDVWTFLKSRKLVGWGLALHLKHFVTTRIFETGREFSDALKGNTGFSQNVLRKIASRKPNTSNVRELHIVASVLNIANACMMQHALRSTLCGKRPWHGDVASVNRNCIR